MWFNSLFLLPFQSLKFKKSFFLLLRCSMIVSRGDLEIHLKGACPLRHFSCPDCGKSGTHHFITTKHQQQCPEGVVPCPNGCGFVPITRRLEANHCKVCPNQVIKLILCREKRRFNAVEKKDIETNLIITRVS